MVRKALMLGLLCVLLIGQARRADAVGLGCLDFIFGSQFNLDTAQLSTYDSRLYGYEANDGGAVAAEVSSVANRRARLVNTDSGEQTPSPTRAHIDLQMSWLPEHWSVVRHISAQLNTTTSLAWSNTGNLLAYLWYDSAVSVTIGLMNTAGQELATRSLPIKAGDTLTFANDLLDDQYIALFIHHADTTQSLIFLQAPLLIPVYTIESVPTLAPCGYFNEVNGPQKCVLWNYATHQVALRVKADSAAQLFIVTPAAKRTQIFPLTSNRVILGWSPNGAYLAIVTDSALKYRFQLAVLRVSDLVYTLIANNLLSFDYTFGYGESFAVWSLDSQTLSFGVADVQGSADAISVWRLKVWHTDNQQIQYPTQMDDPPNFSADRTHALVVDVSDDQHWYVSLLDVRTGTIQKLANEHRPGTFAGWERNGKLLWVETNEPDGVHFIWADADGSNVRQVVIPNNYFSYVMVPSSPDQEAGGVICHFNISNFADSGPYRLLYTGNKDAVNVWVLDLRTQALHALFSLADAEGLINTYISPNGQFIALGQSDDCSPEATRTNPSALAIASVDGRIIHKVALSAMPHSIAWSPDSTMLIYNVYNTTTMQVITRDGTLIRQYDDIQISDLNNYLWKKACYPALANQ